MRLRLAIPVLALPLALVGGTGTASAAPAPTMSVTVDDAAATAAKPTVRITSAGRAVGFSPTSVSGRRSASSPVPCTSSNYAFRLSNSTSVKQQLIVGGKAVFAPIPAHKSALICGYSSRAFTVKFHLKSSPMATLTARFT